MRCDLGQPGCQNCAKSGRVCSGYYRPHTFVLSKDVVLAPDDKSVTEFDSGLVLVSRWRADPGQKDRAQALFPRLLQHDTSIPKEVSPSHAYRDKLFELFLDHRFPAKDQPVPALEKRDWILQVLELPTLTPGLTHAVLAVCTAHIGRRNNDNVLLKHSLPLYGQGLRDLQRALCDPSWRDNEQTLAAISALLLYELSECPGNTVDGYMSHYNGFMELLRLRGPKSCRSGLAHSLFLVLRLHTVFQGLVRRSASFLIEPSWIQNPWGSEKSHFDLLLDIVLELPVLFVQSDAIAKIACPQERLKKFLETIHKGQRMESLLTTWLARFEPSVNGPLYYPELKFTENASGGYRLSSIVFQFPAFFVAQNVVYYWLGLLIVHAHLCFMYNGLERLMDALASVMDTYACTCDSTSENEPGGPAACVRHFNLKMLPPLAHRRNWGKTTAYNICQSIDYFLQEDLRDFGTTTVIPALAIVKTYWGLWPGDWTREISWAQHMLKDIMARGSGIAGHL
ncbi:hypothetical protein PFICI_14999 [Pestalotiopsis fici W106-1]|uniref:Zn(2)-C6 fungal-type domain-containing protein n=1 Tax=Pestalotiopsis fici (strain W106-1 / CGMCC3.15140) TaxID=1229662 RepID=W3WHY5_PESFW|nr:uncharacterized protein PFICI_14999 [Pestalotiopsis fici W106-1]ETS73394.1 hypothetical protein PFICI_14999 [Pestalotiopsis fici W106-1]